MKRRLLCVPILAGLSYLSISYAANTAPDELSGRPQAIGFYSAGCLAHATALPPRGPGFTVMRSSRNRYHGHPNLIAFVQRLANYAVSRGRQLLIGDLSQPRGGPMTYGHRSHQNGLDVDIWFYQKTAQHRLSHEETERLLMLTVIHADRGKLNPARWSPFYRNVLRYAAEDPEVERIFVNPIIKGALCDEERENRWWLQKIRPWWGHDGHFHVRLRCPKDSHQCKSQKPPPPGDGCNPNLRKWAQKIQQTDLQPSTAAPEAIVKAPVLPTACKAILANRRY